MRRSKKGYYASRRGFTLVEILGVMTILVIVMGVVLGTAGYASKRADRAKCIKQLQDIEVLIAEYRSEHGHIPKTANDGGFNNRTDPWGQDFIYQLRTNEGRHSYQLGSKGPDGRFGVANKNSNNVSFLGRGDDITNRNGSY